jgi:hypothetical protein
MPARPDTAKIVCENAIRDRARVAGEVLDLLTGNSPAPSHGFQQTFDDLAVEVLFLIGARSTLAQALQDVRLREGEQDSKRLF